MCDFYNNYCNTKSIFRFLAKPKCSMILSLKSFIFFSIDSMVNADNLSLLVVRRKNDLVQLTVENIFLLPKLSGDSTFASSCGLISLRIFFTADSN